MADKGEIRLVVSSVTYSTIYYILSRFENKELVKEKIRKFKVIAETSDLSDKVIEKGLSSKFSDFEDSLQYYCAINMNCKVLITGIKKILRNLTFRYCPRMNI